ncbi:MAG: type II toxin-antitoxin system VapC family toxin [Spongiibacteraceae bacterium]
MIGLDTNVLARYIVEDDEKQARIATRLIDNCPADDPAFVSHLVLVELTWVLSSCYDADKNAVVAVIEQLLQTKQLMVERGETVWHALDDYKKSSADFSDCLLNRINQEAGCLTTVTFDKNAAKLAGMELCR